MPADVPILQLPKPTYSQSRKSSGDDAGGNGTNNTGTGARTPRHVQWAPAVSVDIAPDDNSQRAIHSLDEAGADPEAFRTLSEALEDEKTRSRSTTPPPDSGQSETAPLNPFESASPNAPANLIPHPEVFIDPDERAGLPAPASAPDPHALETEHAADLVRAHTRRRKIIPSLPKLRLPSQSAAVEAERQRIITGARRGQDGTLDVESAPATAGGGAIGGVSAGGGILSALLALYDQHDDGASDGGSSSGVSTPSASTRGRRARHAANRSRASTADSSPASPNRRTNAHERAASNQSQSQSQSQSQPQANRSKRFSMPVVGKVLGLDSRPAKERNGAGVLGPLIATTAGAASAAAPTSSTVVPDVKRPGYHLSRYSLEDDGHRRAYHRRGKQSTASTMASGPETAPVPRASESDSYFSLPATRVGSTTPGGTPGYKNRWSGVLKDFPTPGFFSTPGTDASDADSEVEWANEKKRERKKRKRKAEIFITRHISDVLARQQFILKLARAMMMFGGPTHRLQAQIVSTGRVLEVPLSCMYLPDTMLVSFDDQTTYTSNIQLIKQSSVLDLAKLTFAYKTYWAVIHDEISVKEASEELDQLMRTKATYSAWLLIFFGGMASASICSLSFSGSFIDSLVCFLLGSTLVLVQTLSARNELYSSMFETTMCTFISFVAAALAMTQKLCYPAISAGSVVLILPGYLVLTGALELSSRSIVSGSVRLCYAVIYCLFLGFGLAIGLEVFLRMVDRSVDAINATDYSCSASHDSDKWYRATPSEWWAFLTVPMFATFLSLRNHAPYNRRELPLLIAISCIGWVINHYVTKAFPNQNDISAAVGAFAVGLIANLYGRFFHGNAFVVMITGILFQLPSGLSNGGLLTFASQSTSGQSDSYLSGFQTALQLVSICIGMTVGLGMSLVVIFPIQSRKRAGGVFSL